MKPNQNGERKKEHKERIKSKKERHEEQKASTRRLHFFLIAPSATVKHSEGNLPLQLNEMHTTLEKPHSHSLQMVGTPGCRPTET